MPSTCIYIIIVAKFCTAQVFYTTLVVSNYNGMILTAWDVFCDRFVEICCPVMQDEIFSCE